MITRLGSLLLLIYALGFVLFAFTLGKPASAKAAGTDAAIVLTGGAGRIEHAIDVLKQHKARRLLVAGVDPSVTKPDLARRIKGSKAWLRGMPSCAPELHLRLSGGHLWAVRRKLVLFLLYRWPRYQGTCLAHFQGY